MPVLVTEELYKRLLADIRSRSVLTEGRRLMTEPELSKRYSVSVGTLRKVVSRLVEENVLERFQGCGTFLKGNRGGTQAPNSLSFRYTALFNLHCQSEIENCILDDSSGRRLHCRYGVSQEEFRRELEETDLAFFAPHQIFHRKNETRLVPMPGSFRKRVEKDFSTVLLDCFRFTETGELFALPLISNPEVFYINTAIFEENGIDLPSHDWTWDEFYKVSGKLKEAGVLPFVALPVAATFLEPFLKQTGGTIFDRYGRIKIAREPFHEFYLFFRRFFEEGLCANGYLLPRSYPLELGDRIAAMTLCNPYLGTHLPADRISEWSYWELPKNKGNGGCLASFGIGVSTGAGDPAAAWKYIEEVVYERMPRLSYLNGVFPARGKERALWKGAGLGNSDAVRIESERATPLPYKYGSYFDQFLYDRLFELLESGGDAESARLELTQLIRENIQRENRERVVQP